MNIEIKGLHPKLADAVSQTLNEAKTRGLSVGLFSGLRQADEQNKLYAIGRTVKNPDGDGVTEKTPMGDTVTNAEGWKSWHNFGLAVDIVFKDSKFNWTWDGLPNCWKDKNGLWTWDRTKDNRWSALGEIGKMFGLTWGGDFTGFKPDFPHFQKTGLIKNVKLAKEILDKSGIDELWEMV